MLPNRTRVLGILSVAGILTFAGMAAAASSTPGSQASVTASTTLERIAKRKEVRLKKMSVLLENIQKRLLKRLQALTQLSTHSGGSIKLDSPEKTTPRKENGQQRMTGTPSRGSTTAKHRGIQCILKRRQKTATTAQPSPLQHRRAFSRMQRRVSKYTLPRTIDYFSYRYLASIAIPPRTLNRTVTSTDSGFTNFAKSFAMSTARCS